MSHLLSNSETPIFFLTNCPVEWLETLKPKTQTRQKILQMLEQIDLRQIQRRSYTKSSFENPIS